MSKDIADLKERDDAVDKQLAALADNNAQLIQDVETPRRASVGYRAIHY